MDQKPRSRNISKKVTLEAVHRRPKKSSHLWTRTTLGKSETLAEKIGKGNKEGYDKARSVDRKKKRTLEIFVICHNNQYNSKLSKTGGAGIHGIS